MQIVSKFRCYNQRFQCFSQAVNRKVYNSQFLRFLHNIGVGFWSNVGESVKDFTSDPNGMETVSEPVGMLDGRFVFRIDVGNNEMIEFRNCRLPKWKWKGCVASLCATRSSNWKRPQNYARLRGKIYVRPLVSSVMLDLSWNWWVWSGDRMMVRLAKCDRKALCSMRFDW